MDSLFPVFIFFALVAVTIAKGARMVPQGSKWVVQRLGKYHCTLDPGLNVIMPYVDSVADKVTTKDVVREIPTQEVTTRHIAVITSCEGMSRTMSLVVTL